MSKFSGKCDLYDHLQIYYPLDVNKLNIYLYNSIIPLRITTPRDFVPFYPYLISFGHISESKHDIRLSSVSFVDQEEQEILTNKLNYAKRRYNRLKRKHVSINKEDILKAITLFSSPRPHEEEIAERVLASPTKATIKGLHLPSHEYFRKLLFKEMINNFYSPQQSYYWIWHEYPSDDVLDALLKEVKDEAGDYTS